VRTMPATYCVTIRYPCDNIANCVVKCLFLGDFPNIVRTMPATYCVTIRYPCDNIANCVVKSLF